MIRSSSGTPSAHNLPEEKLQQIANHTSGRLTRSRSGRIVEQLQQVAHNHLVRGNSGKVGRAPSAKLTRSASGKLLRAPSGRVQGADPAIGVGESARSMYDGDLNIDQFLDTLDFILPEGEVMSIGDEAKWATGMTPRNNMGGIPPRMANSGVSEIPQPGDQNFVESYSLVDPNVVATNTAYQQAPPSQHSAGPKRGTRNSMQTPGVPLLDSVAGMHGLQSSEGAKGRAGRVGVKRKLEELQAVTQALGTNVEAKAFGMGGRGKAQAVATAPVTGGVDESWRWGARPGGSQNDPDDTSSFYGSEQNDGTKPKVEGERAVRLLKNRESAARSRQRKKVYTEALENTVSNLSVENAELKAAVQALSSENKLLKTVTALKMENKSLGKKKEAGSEKGKRLKRSSSAKI